MTRLARSGDAAIESVYTGPGAFAVRALPEPTQRMIARLGGGVLVLFGAFNFACGLLLSGWVSLAGLFAMSAATVLVGAALWVLERWAPGFIARRFGLLVHAVVLIAGLLITVGLISAGAKFAYAAVLYVILAIFAVFLMRPAGAAFNVLLVGVEYGVVVALQTGIALPVFEWAYLMLPIVVVSVTFGLMLQRTDRLAASEKRARQAALAATEAKSAFLATMSHEIRTPLNAVLGMSNLLTDTELTAEQQDFARTISVSGEALLAIINDILDFSKIEAGHIELDLHPFDLREVVENVLEVTAPAATVKHLELAGGVSEVVPNGLVGDATRVRQILLNLVNNAVKFTPEGEVVLTVDAEPRGDDAVLVRATVRDTGIGIRAEAIDALFESFTQADASTTRRFGGTGLGLTISRRLTELMGGRLWAESDGEGTGASFHLEFPAPAVEMPTADRERDVLALSDLRVLVVDDNATNRYLVRMQAESWGLQVRDTEFPRVALEWIERGDPFDLAILDMQMPEMDGLQLAEAIATARSPELPTLIMTSLGRVDRGDADVAWLTKPVKPSQLFDTLVGLVGADPERPGRGAAATAAVAHTGEFDRELGARHPLRILLAEDNALNQQMALQTLARLGYTADVASNGREAIDAIRAAPYDVVLMDVQMPEMDGLTAARRICAEWPRERRPRLVAMTANAVAGDREECLDAGMDDYVAKPIRVRELVAALTDVPATEAPAHTRASAVDASLRAMVGDNDEAIVGFLDLFLNRSAPLIDRLFEDLAADDADAFTIHAHTLKSNAASFGSVDLAETCRRLEEAGRSGEIAEATEQLECASVQVEQLVRDVQKLKKALG